MRAKGIELGWSSRLCIRLACLAHAAYIRHLPLVGRLLQSANRAFTGADIDCRADLHSGVLIPHTVGIVVGSTAIVRTGAVLMPHVTLGASDHSAEGRRHPLVEENAYIGAGAVVIGPITVGRDSVVGANAVVTRDVDPGTTVVGVPAQVVGTASALDES